MREIKSFSLLFRQKKNYTGSTQFYNGRTVHYNYLNSIFVPVIAAINRGPGGGCGGGGAGGGGFSEQSEEEHLAVLAGRRGLICLFSAAGLYDE